MPDQELARLKVHRRQVRLDGRDHTLLTPRLVTGAKYATNRFHDTWHVLSDFRGIDVLSRLCWSLAYQRQEGTAIVIDPQLLVPNPFDADPSSPIVVLNNDLGSLNRAEADDLRARLPFAARPDGTVVLTSWGLDEALADLPAFREAEDRAGFRWNDHQQRRWIDKRNGLVVLAGPPPVLRGWAIGLSHLATPGVGGNEGDAEYLDDDRIWHEGEVQLIEDLMAKVSDAVAAREQLFPGRGHEELSDDERRQMWTRPALK